MEQKKKKFKLNWVFKISIFTFIMAFIMSTLSETSLSKTPIIVSFLVVIFIVFFGVVFDVIGIAITAVAEKPFHSMASARITGAVESIRLIKNASKVSNICSDVVGDICGIVSGASVAFIILEIAVKFNDINIGLFTVLLSSLAASLTVGGKAIGKEIAMNHSKGIIHFCGRFIHVFLRKNKR